VGNLFERFIRGKGPLVGLLAVVSLLLVMALPSPVMRHGDAAPAGGSPVTTDRDGDGYTELEEQAIFGAPGRDRIRCGSDAWPSDVMSAYDHELGTQNRVTIQDIGSFMVPVDRLETSPGHANYSPRWDLNPGPSGGTEWINLGDLARLYNNGAGLSATPPMFEGAEALNGPYCSAGVRFFKKATTPFDAFAKNPGAWAGTSNARYSGMLLYPPASDKHHSWYLGEGPNEGFFYRNAGGIEIGGSHIAGVSAEHALHDAQGNPCYLPFPSGGPFTRYIADVGNQEYRDLLTDYIVEKTNDYPQYIGPYLDDVNLRIAYVSCGDDHPDGNNSAPIDPRTGQALNEQNWQTYWVGLLKQIRNALPSPAKIAHNAPWFFLPTNDPEHIAQVKSADYIEMEFGFNELDGVGGQFGWNAKMAYVDWVHSQGSHVIDQEYQGGQPFTDQQITYGLANFFLFTDGQDYFAIFDNADPNDDWTRYGSTLGEPLGGRYQVAGTWRRDFEHGYVTVDPAAKVGSIVMQ
jgi:hypothetical protein